MQPTLITQRLILRPFQMEDAGRVQLLAGAYEVAATTLNIPHPYPDGAAEAWIGGHAAGFAAGEEVVFAITRAEDRLLIGAIGLMIQAAFARAEMGYWMGVPYWSNGYTTEAAAEVARYGFEELGLNRIHACYVTHNLASGRVMQKIGMQPEGLLRQHVRKWEGFEDLALYGLLKSDWQAARRVGEGG